MPYKDWPASLMASQEIGLSKLAEPPPPVGATSAQVIGSFWLVDGKPRPNTCPPTDPGLKLGQSYGKLKPVWKLPTLPL